MGPIRDLKRKKKPEKDLDLNAPTIFRQPMTLDSSDWWDDFSHRLPGSSKDRVSSFESVFKFSRRTFNYICSLVKDEMMSKHVNLTDLSGHRLSLNDRVAVALTRLSSGGSLSVLRDTLGIHQSAVGQITWQFVEAMEERALHHLRWPSTAEDIRGIKDKFESIRGLPNCCGAIDVTHVTFGQSSTDPFGQIWCDSENNQHSMILQAIVDPTMRFVDVFAGMPGSLSDGETLRCSRFFKLAEEGKRLNGEALKLADGTEIREYIIGDSGFPHLPWLLTPYRRRSRLLHHQSEFNRRHSATRKVARRALTRLKDQWRIIQGTVWRPDKHKLPRIILVCCLLHNILIDLDDEIQMEALLSQNRGSDYRKRNWEAAHNNKSAWNQREKLALCLSGEQVSSHPS
ncbi:unnamed protein product [Cuscuta epithymum]|uniref:DDE Tnp4 domain-containing protein n=2 Tax=Cuscuta epithymum TaxID=186058 RepID=A0AAV0ETP6_9ASTE|nr:unnamed protein product [Cuscuta epithymum]